MYAIGPINYVLITLLLLAAVGSMAVGLRRYWRRIALGKAWPVAAVGETKALPFNGTALIRRGLLLSRLMKRPAAGVAHLTLFFGALFEIAGHGLFPLSFVGIPVYEGWFGHWLMGFGREVAGLMIFSGTLFMIVRRLAPPERLTVDGERRGFLPMSLLLLAIILCGYVAEGFRLTDAAAHRYDEFLGNALAAVFAGLPAAVLSSGNLGFWWIHGLLGVAFIALIAHTPMSHLLLGPANSALASRRSGIQLRPIDFEAEPPEGEEPVFGAAKLADLSRKNLLDLSACLWCGRCHEACPAAQTGKALSPKKVMTTCADWLAQGRANDAGLVDAIGLEAAFNCTSCAACVEQCPVSNSPAEIVLEFRRHFVMDRSEMPDTMAAANANMEKRGHPFVGTSANSDDWRNGLDVPLYEPGETEYLLWLGCAVTYEERAQQIARAMVRILEAAQVSYGILEGPHCTGDPAKMMGNEMQFVDTAQGNIEEFKEMGVRKVITMCAHCFNSFDRYYPELGSNWETIPHSVLIDQLVRDGKIEPSHSAQKIAFHDPCYLARHNDIMAAPRRAIGAVGQIVEMPRNRKDSFCCGGGGGNYWGGKGGTARIGDVRAQEAIETGADKIATSCPFCMLMLTAGVTRFTEERKVFDIAELVAEALPLSSPPLQHMP